jgi:hypothetical protein
MPAIHLAAFCIVITEAKRVMIKQKNNAVFLNKMSFSFYEQRNSFFPHSFRYGCR